MANTRQPTTSITSRAALRVYLLRRAYHYKLISKTKEARKLQKTAIRQAKSDQVQWLKTVGYDFFSSFIISIKQFPIHVFAAVLLSSIMVGGSAFLYQQIFKDLPTPSDLILQRPNLSTRILDRNGQLLYKIYDDENRTWIPLREIPKTVIYATIAIEDQDFYYHHGFSLRGIIRAAIAISQGESIQGGSTLTQQLVKKRLLTPARTVTRKLKELLLAIMVEQTYTKDQILEMYLNQVPYGGSAYGIEEASQRYFGKSAKNITLPEAALLAGLPVAPSVYNPFGPTPELALQRQAEVLRRMLEDGYITAEDADRAKSTELAFQPDTISIEAPHFVMYVRHLLAQQYGEDILNRGGLEVTTSLDLTLQKQVEKTVVTEVAALKNLRIGNGAALVTNPQTGEILSMVGSVNYFDTANDGQVNVTLAPRQPGSSIKPLTYALALENGFTASTLIDDAPVTYSAKGSPPYSPKNYDGKYHGRVSVRESLGSSYNIPAVKTLNALGISSLIDKAEEMGITTWSDRKRFGLSLTLGGGEVRMTELATAYATFANGGKKVPLNPILAIKNDDGKTLYENPCLVEEDDSNTVPVDQKRIPATSKPSAIPTVCNTPQVLKPGVAYVISSILSDNTARTPAFGSLSVLNIKNHQVAVKTGTTNSLRDNWTIGYSTDRLVAVWVGNNDNTPMSYVASGITGASPIWNKIMVPLLPTTSTHVFATPPDVVRTAICSVTNTLTCNGCPRVTQEFYVSGTQPTKSCNNGYFASKEGQPQSPAAGSTPPLTQPQTNVVGQNTSRSKKLDKNFEEQTNQSEFKIITRL